jgi:RNA polymerase sigma-70 factor (ECF subfamily)
VDFDRSALLRPTLEVVYAVASSTLPELLRHLRVPVHDVEDLLHNVVVAAHRNLGRFQSDESDPLGALRAWIYGIAWRQASKERGRAHRRREVSCEDLTDHLDDDALDPEQLIVEAEQRRMTLATLRKLRPERAVAVSMHYVQEMTVPAIAKTLGVNPQTVASRIHRGCDDFRKHAKRHAATMVQR